MSSETTNNPYNRLTAAKRLVAAAEAAQPAMAVTYRGTQGPLFRLVLQTSILTLLTLGIYRFWAKTRVRKYFWSATAPGGDPLEYTGNGLEKLLGFLIAVAFLAVYLGLFQLLLIFAGLSLFSGDDSGQNVFLQTVASQITVIAVLPFIFYAQYRARRYILSRSRWRGVRFGVDAAAWGYVWRAIGHWILTSLTLGLLLPRQTFWLEKYKVDRTWYGNARFSQGGRWTQLYPAMKHFFFAAALVLVPGFLAIFTAQPVWFSVTILGGIWSYYAFVYYRVETFRILGNEKRLGDRVGFVTEPKASRVFWTYVLGGLLASTCAGLVFSVFYVVASNLLGMTSLFGFAESLDLEVLSTPDGAQMLGFGLLIVGYLAMLLSYGVFSMIFISQPVLEHYVTRTRILNGAALEEIQQRSRDEMVEAEGFADALDVGAAI